MSEKKNRKGVCGGGGCADGEAAATKRGVAPVSKVPTSRPQPLHWRRVSYSRCAAETTYVDRYHIGPPLVVMKIMLTWRNPLLLVLLRSFCSRGLTRSSLLRDRYQRKLNRQASRNTSACYLSVESDTHLSLNHPIEKLLRTPRSKLGVTAPMYAWLRPFLS